MNHTPRDPDADQQAWEEIVHHLQQPEPEHPSAPEAEPEVYQVPWRSALPAADGVPRELADESEEDWRPPDPGHVTAGLSTGTLTAWLLLMVVPVVLVILAALMDGLPWWLWMPGLATVISSIITLLGGLPEQRDLGDDGARV